MLAALALSVVLAPAPSSADTLLQLSRALLDQARELNALSRGYSDSTQFDAANEAGQLLNIAEDVSDDLVTLSLLDSLRKEMACAKDRNALHSAMQSQILQALKVVQLHIDYIDGAVVGWQRLQELQQRGRGTLTAARKLQDTLRAVHGTLERIQQ